MTQAFCHLVLHYSVARLSWKTIKSLRRSRSRLRRNKCDADKDDDSVSTPTTHENDSDVSPVEYEILQGWTILAFHSIYVSLGIEYLVRFFIPFYFHMKMMVLIVTFVVPSWAGRNGGGDGTSEYGLSPVISYWFDYLIVPSVHKVHNLMDQDPKGWASRQAMLLPFYFIDYFVLPGILATEEEKQLVRNMRREGAKEDGDGIKAPPSEMFPTPVAKSNNLSPDQYFGTPTTPGNRPILKEIDENSQSDTDSSVNISCTDEAFARNRPKQIVEEKRLTAEQPGNSGKTPKTPPHRRGQKSSTLNRKTPNHNRTPLLPKTTPTKNSPVLTNKKACSLSLSPVAKSRLASSAMKLRKFSLEHQTKNDLPSPSTKLREVEADASGTDTKRKKKSESSSKKRSDQGNMTRSSARKARTKRHERLSVGDQFRELVTGDSNIRVRDHLFDLDLPSSPPVRHTRPGDSMSRTARNRAEREQIDVSNVTTRRSSRPPVRHKRSGDSNSSSSSTAKNRAVKEREQNDVSKVTARRSSRLNKNIVYTRS